MPSVNNPKISVVMPTWNQSHLIKNAIMSIINQTEENFELIIVDDGSTDNTPWIIKEFNDPRIKYFPRQHEGLVSARNFGNSVANAKIIATQDSDDLSMPNRLEKCLKAIKSCDVVYHGAVINMWDKQFNCITRKYMTAPKFDKEKIKEGQYITGWPVFRKSVWQEKPFRMETQFMYDWSMYLDWSEFRFKNIDEVLYEYVRQENSASIQFESDGRREQSHQEIKKIFNL